MKYSSQSDVHRTEGRKLFSRKNNMLTNHDSNRNRNMSRIDEGKESKTNEDKQKNEVRDAFTTVAPSIQRHKVVYRSGRSNPREETTSPTTTHHRRWRRRVRSGRDIK